MGSFGEWVAGKIGGTIGDEIGKDLQPVLPPNDTGNVVHDGLVKDGELLGPAIGGAWAGAELGAELGSFGGLPGTIVGTAAGTIGGGLAGLLAGGWAGDLTAKGIDAAAGALQAIEGAAQNPTDPTSSFILNGIPVSEPPPADNGGTGIASLVSTLSNQLDAAQKFVSQQDAAEAQQEAETYQAINDGMNGAIDWLSNTLNGLLNYSAQQSINTTINSIQPVTGIGQAFGDAPPTSNLPDVMSQLPGSGGDVGESSGIDRSDAGYYGALSPGDAANLTDYTDGSMGFQAPVPYLNESQQFSSLSSSQSAQSQFNDALQQTIDGIGSTNQTIGNAWPDTTGPTNDTTSGQTTYPQNPVTVDPSGKPTNTDPGNTGSNNPDPNNTGNPNDNTNNADNSGGGGDTSGDGPVVLDLAGNGINVTKLTSSNVFVDSTGDGFKNRTAWAGAGNAMLFFDPNNTNAITQANQIAFKDWDPTAATDMQALLDVFDTNHDGKLDAGDADFADFKLMVTNADGTQTVETLAQAGITSIDLSANNVHQSLSDGSSIDGETTYTTTSGTTGTAATVTFAYDSHGYAVRTTTSTDATTGAVTVDNKAFNSNGSLANETISTTSADGTTKTIKYDLNGDGQIDVVQTDNTVTSGGVTTETLTDATLAGVLIDRTVTATSIDPTTGVKTVTIDRDSNGAVAGGIYVTSQHEVDTTSNGLTTVLVQDLNPDGSIKDQVITTPSAAGLTSTVQQDLNGDGVFDLTTVTATVVDATTGARTTTVTDKNADGSERDQTVTVASADGQSKTVTSDPNGDGVVDLTTTSNIVQGTSSSLVAGTTGATTTIVETAANGGLINEVVRFESNDSLVKVVQSDSTGAGTSSAPVFDRTTTDVTAVDATTGVRTETVTDRNANGSLLDQSATIIGTDGISRTTEADTTGAVDGSGNAVFNKIETVVVGSAGSVVDTASSYAANGALISQTITTTSADGLTKTVQSDIDGSGAIDWTTTTATAAVAGEGTTVTVTDAAGNGTVVDTTVKTTSADGLVVTTQSDVGGDNLTTTDATAVDATTGIKTETVSVSSANGTLESQVVTVTSADRNSKTISSDFNGDGHVDQVETIVKQSNGSVIDTVSSYAVDGSLVGQTISTTSADGLSKTVTSNIDGKVDTATTDNTVLNADGSRTETVTRSANDGSQISQTVTTVSATDLSSSVTRNVDGKIDGTTTDVTVLNLDGSRTETVSVFDSTGAKISSTATITSATGLSSTTLVDENGDGVTDVTRTDSIVIGTDGSRIETVTNTNANGTLRNQTVTTTSANGLNITVQADTTGDGAVDRIVSVATQADGDVVRTTAIHNQDGSLVGSTVTTTSANGLSQTTQTDVNGDGVFDETRTDVTVLNADGSRTETVTNVVGTTTVSAVVTTISADGTSTVSTTTIDGVLQETDSSVTSYAADGGETRTATVKSGDGATQSTTVTSTSADRKTTTTRKNTYGTTPASSVETKATQSDGSVVDTLSDYDVLGALAALTLTTTSANGLSVVTAFDDNGDGSVDETESDVKTIAANGSTTEAFSDSSNALHAITGGYAETASVVTVTSANGLSKTITTTGTNGQASLDHSAVVQTVINADGSQVTTDTETVGAAHDVAVTSVNRTGLTVTKEWSTLGNDVFDHTDVTVTNLDGSTTETITNLNADGSTGELKTINVSLDGRTRTITDMTNEDGVINTAVTNITPSANGATVRVTTNTNGSGTLISEITRTSSATGLSNTITLDTNGDGATDETETNTTVLNADGSRTVTLVNTFQIVDTDPSTLVTERHVTTTSADGLSVTTSIYEGDILNEQTTSVKTNNSDGSTTVRTTQESLNSVLNWELMKVVGSTVTTTSADGRTVTTTYDLHGDGVTDEIKTSQTAANGVNTLTDSYYDLSGNLTGQTITTTSADQRDVAIARNNAQKPASDTLETTLVSADGSGSYSWTEQNSVGAYMVVADHLVDSNGIDTVSLTQNGSETTYKIAQSQEAADLTEIQRIYWVALGRMMTAEEGQTWLKYMTPSGLDTRQLANDLLASVGFGTTSAGGSGESTPIFSSAFTGGLGSGVPMSGLDFGDTYFVNSMYQNTFGRQPDDAELNTWVSQLEAGSITRADLVIDLSRLQGQVAANALASDGDMSVEYRPDGTKHYVRPDHWYTYKIHVDFPDDPPPNPRDPLVINFGSGDFQLTSLASSQAHYDFTGSGFATQTGWIAANEGILILDNGKGGSTVTPDELLGAQSGDGFEDLAALDSNHDGVIDANDAAFSQLKVWVDQNLNGQLDSGELKSLSDLGITSISLSTTPTNLTVNGNQVVEQATITINGVAHTISEVEFSTNTSNTIYSPPAGFVYARDALNLPELAGYGTLPSLQVAMSENSTLLSDVKNFVLYAGQMSGSQFDAGFQSLLYEWAGASNIDPASRGPYVDARHLAFVYAYYGIDPASQPAYALNPNGHTGPQWESIYQSLVDQLEVRFASQVIDSLFANGTDIASLQSNPFLALSDIDYDPSTNAIGLDLDELVSSIVDHAPSGPAAADNYYDLTFGVVRGLRKDLFGSDTLALANSVIADLGYLGQRKDVQKIAATAFGLNVIDEDGATGSISLSATKSVVFLGAGNKTVTGGSSNLYVYSSSSSNDEVTDTGDGTRLVMSGVESSNVILQADASGDLIVKRLDTGATITFAGDLGKDIASRTFSHLSSISFGNGTIWTLPQDLSFTWAGTPANTILTGTSYGPNVFEFGPGGDVVNAATPNDLFVFGRDDGQATVNLDGGGRLKLTAGIAPSDVILQSDSNDDLIVKFADSSDSITLVQDLGKNIGNATFSRVGEIDFADGTALDLTKPLTFSYTGTATNTTLVGTTFGTNIFDLGPGGDTVTAGSANDVFEFEKADGQASVTLAGGGTVEMASDIARSDIILQANANGDLTVKLHDTGDSLTLQGDLWHTISNATNSAVSSINFADGSSIDLNQPLTFSWNGTQANTVLTGSTFGSNIFNLGPGGDAVQAGSSTDEFDFDKGDGQATVTLAGGGTVRMAADIIRSDVVLQTDVAGDLTVRLLDTGDSITLRQDLWHTISNATNSAVGTISFADGTSIDLNQPLTYNWYGTATDTTLVGSNFGSNVFDLGPGGDAVTAASASDVFEFDKGDGQASVKLAGGGTVQMAPDVVRSDVEFQTNANGDLIVGLRGTGDSITLLGDLFHNIANQTYSVASSITFADGSSINLNQPLTYNWYGTATDTTLVGSNFGSNVFDLGVGGDTITAGSANDEFDFDKGDGQATVTLDGGGTLRMAAGIMSTDVMLQADADGDLTIRLRDTGDSITLLGDLKQNIANQTYSVVSAVEFADGSTIDLNQPLTFTSIGTAGQTNLVGSRFGSNVFDLGPGGDTVTATTASDVFAFEKGDGQATVALAGGGTVSLAAGIAPSDVELLANLAGDLTVKLRDTGDSITLQRDLNINTTTTSLATITFADGTTWDSATIGSNLEIFGTSGNDSITMPQDGATVDPGAGDDSLSVTGNGSDRIIFAKGDGHDTLNNPSSGYNRNDTLILTDIDPNDVQLSRSGNAMTLTVVSTGDTFTANDQFWGDGSQIQGLSYIQFADGTIWDRAAITASVSPSQTTVTYNVGDGALDVYPSAEENVIDFGSGISADELSYQDNDGTGDLRILFAGHGSDMITIHNDLSYSGGAITSGISELYFSDGSSINLSNPLTYTWNGGRNDALGGSDFGSNVFNPSGGGDAVTFGNSSKGGTGQNAINYLQGDGTLDVYLNGGNGVVDFDSSISSQNVLFQDNDGSGDLRIMFAGDSSDVITIHGDLSYSGGAISSGVTRLSFSDGTSINLGSPLTYTWGGGRGDALTGSKYGSNVFNPSGGGDAVTFGNSSSGGTGQNTVNYSEGDGSLDVYLNGGTGVIDLGSNISIQSVLLQDNDRSGDLRIMFAGDSSDVITVHGDLNYSAGAISSGITKLNFSDGSSLNLSSPLTYTWSGGRGDALAGSNFGSNVFNPSGGGDAVTFGNSSSGGTGQNTVNYSEGDGSLDVYLNSGTGVIDFDSSISSQNVLFQDNDGSGDLRIMFAGDSSDVITIHGDLSYSGGAISSGVTRLSFSDGTSINLGSPLTYTWGGGRGDALTGSKYGSNVFNPSGGGDAVTFGNSSSGGTGQNTVNYSEGDGSLDVYLNGGTGVIDLGSNISIQSVLLQDNDRSGDLRIMFAGDSSDVITVHGDLNYSAGAISSGITKLNFSDGSSLNLSSPLTYTWSGGRGDALAGSNFGSNVFNPSGGGDAVTFGNSSSGGTGQNTVNYSEGDGSLDVYLNSGTGVIDFDSSISSQNVFLQDSDGSGDLRIMFAGDSSDVITIHNDLNSSGGVVSSGITKLNFSDGSSIDLNKPLTFTWNGSSGSTISGSNFGSNVFELGAGSETITGGAAGNRYEISTATGQATIYANTSAGSPNELNFDGGISDQNLWFVQSGNDLNVDLLGTNTSVSLKGWFSGGSSQLQDITAGGLKIDSQISQLVQSMATYATNNPGFDPTSSSTTVVPNDPTLQSAVSAAWHS